MEQIGSTSEGLSSVESKFWRLQRDQSIVSFVYRESDLLDANQLEDWLALYSDDAHYWIPLDWTPHVEGTATRQYGTGAGSQRVNIVYDDMARLRDRITRMRSGSFWDETPPSRVVRLLTNVEARSEYLDDQGRSHVIVHAKTLVRQVRRERENVLVGQVTHDLIEVSDLSWQIFLKKITLVNAEKPLWNMTYIL
jgi:3-phenylpropionate/cinnamic acid dioxygenase small subunit